MNFNPARKSSPTKAHVGTARKMISVDGPPKEQLCRYAIDLFQLTATFLLLQERAHWNSKWITCIATVCLK